MPTSPCCARSKRTKPQPLAYRRTTGRDRAGQSRRWDDGPWPEALIEDQLRPVVATERRTRPINASLASPVMASSSAARRRGQGSALASGSARPGLRESGGGRARTLSQGIGSPRRSGCCYVTAMTWPLAICGGISGTKLLSRANSAALLSDSSEWLRALLLTDPKAGSYATTYPHRTPPACKTSRRHLDCRTGDPRLELCRRSLISDVGECCNTRRSRGER